MDVPQANPNVDGDAAQSFLSRTAKLRSAWAEKRTVEALGVDHSHRSQLELLRLLHGWVEEDVAAITGAYGHELTVLLTAIGDDPSGEAFRLTVAHNEYVHFGLYQRELDGTEHWRIAASSGSVAAGDQRVPAAPGRRAGSWTRDRVDDLVLSLVAAFERGRSRRRRPSAGRFAEHSESPDQPEEAIIGEDQSDHVPSLSVAVVPPLP